MSHSDGFQTLDRIAKGDLVRVLAVTGDDAISRRLNDLGVRAGVTIQVVRRAPMGDPTVFELCGYQLCLRRSESARVRVAPQGEPIATDADLVAVRRTGLA